MEVWKSSCRSSARCEHGSDTVLKRLTTHLHLGLSDVEGQVADDDLAAGSGSTANGAAREYDGTAVAVVGSGSCGVVQAGLTERSSLGVNTSTASAAATSRGSSATTTATRSTRSALLATGSNEIREGCG